MAEVIITGPEGRLEGRYHHVEASTAPLAVILHPHPQYGGNMNNRVVQGLAHMFAKRGFGTLRFNFRGVGRSQGQYGRGEGELMDAAAALDWLQTLKPESKTVWVAGFSFGAWIGMQLLMRRPEMGGFISISPPANMYDFSFLAPCPSSGLIIHGDADEIVPQEAVLRLVDKLALQKGIIVDYENIEGAGHLFGKKLEMMLGRCEAYLDRRIEEDGIFQSDSAEEAAD
ncbi:MAG: alpha/beta hydrolase [Alphaproteobacteria bacterium]|jgi:alpha/beta superfamily hydrolase